MNPTLQIALTRAVRTFAQAFVAALVASQAQTGIALSPLHALELAAIAGGAALLHNLPPEKLAADPVVAPIQVVRDTRPAPVAVAPVEPPAGA